MFPLCAQTSFHVLLLNLAPRNAATLHEGSVCCAPGVVVFFGLGVATREVVSRRCFAGKVGELCQQRHYEVEYINVLQNVSFPGFLLLRVEKSVFGDTLQLDTHRPHKK